ncbi:hypothetical protein FB561_0826 [Kribbella amoyensis]|uniref:Uncharacterized protein n=1 Tax=Kribbella amoyensis TaxID=996641 RepID=A0A561BLK9_9ACTN|nr:hypothetical protein [Kribbella amoyensis]TWD79761.1 hypothetical protein FB561_0826 [Kribbella amoyensis]
MTMTPEERAVDLTDHAATALIRARSMVGIAAEDSAELGKLLIRSENDIDELTGHAAKVREIVEVEPETFLRYASEVGDDINKRLQGARTQVEEIGDYLNRAGLAVREGRDALEELGQLPQGQTDEVNELYQRLGGLQGAVVAAQDQLTEVDSRLVRAQSELETLRAPVTQASRGAAEALITDTHRDVSEQAQAGRRTLGDMAERLEDSTSQFSAAAARGEDLARTAQAAMNPTPVDQQVEPGSADKLASRLSGESQDNSLER